LTSKIAHRTEEREKKIQKDKGLALTTRTFISFSVYRSVVLSVSLQNFLIDFFNYSLILLQEFLALPIEVS